jgi:hypothetical protein
MKYRTIRRHVWEKHKEVTMIFLKTQKGKGLYKKEKGSLSEPLLIQKICIDFATAASWK